MPFRPSWSPLWGKSAFEDARAFLDRYSRISVAGIVGRFRRQSGLRSFPSRGPWCRPGAFLDGMIFPIGAGCVFLVLAVKFWVVGNKTVPFHDDASPDPSDPSPFFNEKKFPPFRR